MCFGWSIPRPEVAVDDRPQPSARSGQGLPVTGSGAGTAEADRALIRQASDEVSRAVTTLVLQEPFFGHLLAGVNRVYADPRVKTMGVGIRHGRVQLMINPTFFVKTLTRSKQRVAVIKHEALHLVLKHLFRGDGGRDDPLIANVAADLVVNQFIGSRWELPDGAILLSSFPQLDLPPDRTFEWYYDALLTEAPAIPAGFESSHSDHSYWGVADPAEEALARTTLSRALIRTRDRSAKGWSLLDAPLREAIVESIAELEPTIDWRRVLRMFSTSGRRTQLHNTLRRPSKRYGTYPGTKVRRHHRLAVAVDTSGSISRQDLLKFFAEINQIHRQGSEVTLIECDMAVREVSRYEGGVPVAVTGGGGTRFDPVFEWLATQPRPFDGLVYLTDGVARPPTLRPREKVLWVLTSDRQGDHPPFGRVVHLDT